MINLLPPNVKQDLQYGRLNTRLRHWIFVCIMVIVGLGIITGFGLLYIRNSVNSYSKQVDGTRLSLQAQNLEQTQKQVEGISNDLKLVIKVLSKEILFSKLFKQIGAAVPNNAVLSGVELSKVEGGIDLVFQAKDYQSATQVQVNLQDPKNNIFEKVDLVTVGCNAPAQGSGTSASDAFLRQYPCQAQVRALFGKNSPYLFINNANAERAKP